MVRSQKALPEEAIASFRVHFALLTEIMPRMGELPVVDYFNDNVNPPMCRSVE